MKLKPSSLFTIVLLPLVLMGAGPATESSPHPPAIGDKVADFALNTLDEKTIRLSDLTKNGPVVLIELRGWVGRQCPICNRQVGEFLSHSKEILATGARVVLIYPGPTDKLKDHAEDFISGKGLPDGVFFVIDPDMKFVSDWDLRWDAPGETAYPSTFVIDRQGIVRFSKISHSHGNRATSGEVLQVLSDEPR